MKSQTHRGYGVRSLELSLKERLRDRVQGRGNVIETNTPRLESAFRPEDPSCSAIELPEVSRAASGWALEPKDPS